MYSATKWARTVITIPLARSSSFQPFSTTSLLRAAESKKPLINALEEFKHSSTFEKLSKSPDALVAIQKLVKVLEKQGAFQVGLMLNSG